jgi:hypothetical protein
VRDSRSVASIMRMIAGDVAVSPSRTGGMELPARSATFAAAIPRVIQTYMYGVPVMMDVGEAEARIARTRRETARRLADLLPPELRAKLEAAGIAIEDVPIWPELLPSLPVTPSYLEPVGRSDLLLVRQGRRRPATA